MVFVRKLSNFLKEVYAELRKTSWLSKKEVLRYTLIVLGVTVLVATLLGGLDYAFSTILRMFIFK